MINWFDMPAEGLSNGGLFEVKELEATENGTYETKGEMYNKVTVNVEGGGGETWNTVFEGDVTIQQGSSLGITIGAMLSGADKIKVTFNGAEYECEKKVTESDGTYYGADPNDFSVYPFRLVILPTDTILFVETAGTYSLKIEEPSSGGSSDFSTAEVTVVWNTTRKTVVLYGANFTNLDTSSYGKIILDGEIHENFEAILYYQKAVFEIDSEKTTASVSVSGNAELSDGNIEITGDCTITIS